MSKGRRSTNELEFQGQVITWLNDYISSHRGTGLDRATQEKPRRTSGKRNDLVVWSSRVGESAFMSLELKTSDTAISDPLLLDDALEKARHWQAPYFAIWNMKEAELYKTPLSHHSLTPADAVQRWPLLTGMKRLEDWLKPSVSASLRKQAEAILEVALGHSIQGGGAAVQIDADIFVSRLAGVITGLRSLLYDEIVRHSKTQRALRKTITRLAAQQGFLGFVDDVNYAIAGQIGYRLVGQILFHFALRRKQPALKEITLSGNDAIPSALTPYWDDVRRFDYEALFRSHEVDTLVTFPEKAQGLVRTLVSQLAGYEWASLSDDVLGSAFERLIPREEQILLGQFYTPRPVANVLAALTIDGEKPLVLDPGCGSGTFLMSAYDLVAYRSRMSHKDLLPLIWGFDISPFATELAAINMFRQDFSEFENFPRVVPGNFFEREPGMTVEFPPPRVTRHGLKKVPIPVPLFDCVIGNPPYLRSQNQDDLDPDYRKKLFSAAGAVGIKAAAKTDLFAFFIYHALRFMRDGSRLGFVTPTSWLTADYASSLQRLLMDDLRMVAIVTSTAEAFFPQVEVNTALLIAEKVVSGNRQEEWPLRFVTFKRRIKALVAGGDEYWHRVTDLVDRIYEAESSTETDDLRIKLVPLSDERRALARAPQQTRNWSKYLRAPLSYYDLFGESA